MATATGKLGYAWNGMMVYGKAGGAWIRNTLDVSCNADQLVRSTAPRPISRRLAFSMPARFELGSRLDGRHRLRVGFEPQLVCEG